MIPMLLWFQLNEWRRRLGRKQTAEHVSMMRELMLLVRINTRHLIISIDRLTSRKRRGKWSVVNTFGVIMCDSTIWTLIEVQVIENVVPGGWSRANPQNMMWRRMRWLLKIQMMMTSSSRGIWRWHGAVVVYSCSIENDGINGSVIVVEVDIISILDDSNSLLLDLGNRDDDSWQHLSESDQNNQLRDGFDRRYLLVQGWERRWWRVEEILIFNEVRSDPNRDYQGWSQSDPVKDYGADSCRFLGCGDSTQGGDD